jgi:hypothetical protein
MKNEDASETGGKSGSESESKNKGDFINQDDIKNERDIFEPVL